MSASGSHFSTSGWTKNALMSPCLTSAREIMSSAVSLARRYSYASSFSLFPPALSFSSVIGHPRAGREGRRPEIRPRKPRNLRRTGKHERPGSRYAPSSAYV
ncbi:hypothetical protein FMUND_12358 [Fusarium mundagurra]|uniref:Uncharacterized protein n=1 Tax=Fusarium mundagurra TaxID=1567541 RepID=A0A8H5Y4X9_9HYPO|nr:hypothetical protein FMUND_12358 [Fusarium mundagurra]